MQEMIELSKTQEQMLSQQQKVVHFEAILPDGSSKDTVLQAGPAQFGADLTSANQVMLNADRGCKNQGLIASLLQLASNRNVEENSSQILIGYSLRLKLK